MSKRRYFEDSKFKPGIISSELRKALSISVVSLPLWVYRMRVLGYPPGYLIDAQNNTLTLFDGKHNTNNNSNPLIDCEDGEIDGEGIHYNKDSFIEYPGFNVALPQGVYDEWYELRMPPMLPQQQLKEALKTMKVTEPVPYKRLKRDLISTPALSPNSTINPNSMHKSIDSSSHYNSNDSIITSHSTKHSRDESHICSNDSLNESKTRDETLESPSSPPNVESIVCENSDLEKANESSENVLIETPKLDSSINISQKSVRKLKLVSKGSPMPTTSNPKRPSLEKWSEGMGDLIYFENLPTSTGVYQNKMKGVIEKIRQKNSQT